MLGLTGKPLCANVSFLVTQCFHPGYMYMSPEAPYAGALLVDGEDLWEETAESDLELQIP